ncbi:MAG: hydantoinase B/oxoprolinase family protein [Planctomycetes bacterium]|nr:hydantoinase B/oxoprolinase family protein [Planctomycetota bacterium]
MASPRIDPVQLEVFHHLVSAFCEEAGARLQRSAASPNIRERRDYSVAMFDREARLVAQAAHIPVHLGSARDAVTAVQRAHPDLERGDVIVLNDPYAGGTHLPDVTMVRPVFVGRGARPEWFLVNRAHHADIGGSVPGSMAIVADLLAEGLILPPVRLRRRGELQRDLLAVFARNVRGAGERRLDLTAQEASLLQFEQRLQQFVAESSLPAVRRTQEALFDYTERAAAAVVRGLRRGRFSAEDELEDDGLGSGPLRVALDLTVRADRLVFDWTRCCDQAKGGVNCNPGIALAAAVYVLRCLCPDRLPTNDGLFRLVQLRTRRGSLVDPIDPAPVAGGNVETSQRLVDVAFAALGRSAPQLVPAASAGTMSNLSLGGVDRRGAAFASYETLPGGAGATATTPGLAAVQTHMTNTRNTPIEELEHRYPLRVRELAVRRGSGGRGRQRGGDGLRKVVEALQPLTVAFLGERHRHGPPGAAGGGAGAPGSLAKVRGGRRQALPAKTTFPLAPGERVEVQTPGGGGHGRR